MRFADDIINKNFISAAMASETDIENEVQRVMIQDVMEKYGLEMDDDDDDLRRKLEGLHDQVKEDLRKVNLDLETAKAEQRAKFAKMQDILVTMVETATILVVDNVYDYAVNLPEIEIYSMPCIAPRWPRMWLEWRQRNLQNVGLACICVTRPDDGWDPGAPLEPLKFVQGGDDYYNEFQNTDTNMWYSANLPDAVAWEAVQWLWHIEMYLRKDGQAIGPLWTFRVAVDENGHPLDIVWNQHFPENVRQQENMQAGTMAIAVWGYTLSFLGCKNVQVVYQRPSDALQKKHRRKRKASRPLVAYNRIRIDPMGNTGIKKRSGPGDGGEQAFHIQPGSFAHYGQCCTDHPPKGLLFGKITGRFWRPQHIKGNPRRGVNVTSYEVGEVRGEPAMADEA